MPRDFAKKSKSTKAPSRGASRKSSKKPVPMFVWVLAVLMFSGLAAGLYFLKMGNPATVAVQTPKSETKLKQTSDKNLAKEKTPEVKITSEDKVPLYDLHEDLINKEVVIPKEDLLPDEESDKFVYSMPCGSFRELSRAEEMKAKIAMTGNSSQIESVVSKGETWFRVKLGPFKRKRQAESIRHRLQDNDIQTCIINAQKI